MQDEERAQERTEPCSGRAREQPRSASLHRRPRYFLPAHGRLTGTRRPKPGGHPENVRGLNGDPHH